MLRDGELVVGSTCNGNLAVCKDNEGKLFVTVFGGYSNRKVFVDKNRFIANERRFTMNIPDINEEMREEIYYDSFEEEQEYQENSKINETIIILGNIVTEESFLFLIDKAINGIKQSNKEGRMLCLDNLRCFVRERKPSSYRGSLLKYRASLKEQIAEYIDWEWEWEIS